MKAVLALSAALLLSQAGLFADSKLEIKPDDTPATLLIRSVGQKVELRLKNGDLMAGKVESATPVGVHLSNLVGKEFSDAVVAVSDISAVIVRMR